jgi:hypothetical protein
VEEGVFAPPSILVVDLEGLAQAARRHAELCFQLLRGLPYGEQRIGRAFVFGLGGVRDVDGVVDDEVDLTILAQ